MQLVNYRDLPVQVYYRVHSTARGRGNENFEFIVCERVQVNPDDSRAMSVLSFFIIQIEYVHCEQK